MSSQKYSRDYLRALPAQTRKDLLKSTIQPFIGQIVGAARLGKTSSLINPTFEHRGIQTQTYAGTGQNLPSVDEICEALREELPECTVTYVEKWVEITPAKKELKKGIEVDWS